MCAVQRGWQAGEVTTLRKIMGVRCLAYHLLVVLEPIVGCQGKGGGEGRGGGGYFARAGGASEGALLLRERVLGVVVLCLTVLQLVHGES